MEQQPVYPPVSLDTPLWRFALSFWQRPEVESTCLSLQEKGWQVTPLLGACWLASQGQKYTGQQPELVTNWHNAVTGPLRQLKKQIPRDQSPMAGVRSAIASAELEAERVELALLYQAFGGLESNPAATPPSVELSLQNIRAAAPEHTTDNEAASLIQALSGYLTAHITGELTP